MENNTDDELEDDKLDGGDEQGDGFDDKLEKLDGDGELENDFDDKLEDDKLEQLVGNEHKPEDDKPEQLEGDELDDNDELEDNKLGIDL